MIDGPRTFPNHSTDILIFLFLLTIVLLVIVPFIFFNFMNRKASVDLFHSLPIKRADLLITLSCASFLLVFIPFAITYWSGYILLYTLYDIAFNLDHLILFVRAILLFSAILIPSLFVIMNTGTTSDSIIYAMIIYVAPFIIYGALEAFSSTYLIGFSSLSATNVLYYISPSVAFVGLLTNTISYIDTNIITVYWIVASFILYIGTSYLYKIWKSEKSEQPFNNNFFFPFVTSLFTAFLFIFSLSLFSLDYNSPMKFLAIQNLIIPVLITLVFYVLLDVIRFRTTKFLIPSLKRFALLIIFSLSLSTLIFTTQGFGFAWNVPAAHKVESVTVKSYNASSETMFSSMEITMSDETSIDQLVNFHQLIVDEFKESNRFFRNTGDDINQDFTVLSLTLSYKLEGGGKFKRNFNIPRSLEDELFALLAISDVQKSVNPILVKDPINLNLFNASMSDEFEVSLTDLTEIRKLYMEDLSQLSSVDFIDYDHELKYILVYPVDDTNYQLNIDTRFPSVVKYLEGKQLIAETSFIKRSMDLSNFYGDNNNVIGNLQISRYIYFDDPNSYPLISNDYARSLEGSLYAIALNKPTERFLFVEVHLNNSEDQVMLIPIK